jgi:hypothetical protein
MTLTSTSRFQQSHDHDAVSMANHSVLDDGAPVASSADNIIVDDSRCHIYHYGRFDPGDSTLATCDSKNIMTDSPTCSESVMICSESVMIII